MTEVLSGGTLVITLHDALSPAEKAVAKSPAGAAQVQESHRQIFTTSSESLREEIKRITGAEVRGAAAELETMTGTVVFAFASGTMVEVFQLARRIPAKTWNGSGSADQQEHAGSLQDGPEKKELGDEPRKGDREETCWSPEVRRCVAPSGLDS